MQEVPAQHTTSSPLSLLEEIRRGGKLALLFRQAAGEQSAGTRKLVRSNRRAEGLLQTLMRDARERQETSQTVNPLSVLRECAAGCTACCRASLVEVTPLEALAMAEHIKEKLSPEEIATLRQRLHVNAKQRFQWRNGEPTGPIPACAFLGEDGLCQTYDARPLVCAGVFSFSRDACQQAQPGPSEMSVPLDREAKAWTAGVSGGLQQALVAAGLDGNLYELHSAFLCVLETGQAFDRWWRREDIFANCHCTDAHSFPRKPKPAKRADNQWRVDRSHSAKGEKRHSSAKNKSLSARRKKRVKR